MKIITTTLWLIALSSFFMFQANACQLNLPESEVRRALNPPVSGHYVKCEEKPEEKCFCMDNIDPWTHDLIDGELVENSDKKFAKELAEKNAEEARKAKEEKCKNFSFKGATIAALRQEMNEWKECK